MTGEPENLTREPENLSLPDDRRADMLVLLGRPGQADGQVDPPVAVAEADAHSAVAFPADDAGVSSAVYAFETQDAAIAAERGILDRLRTPGTAVRTSLNGSYLLVLTWPEDDDAARKAARKVVSRFAGNE